MTLVLAPTGAALGDLDQLATHDAVNAQHHTRLRTVADPALRVALDLFDSALTAPLHDRTRLRSGLAPSEAVLIGWGSTSFDVVCTITGQALQLAALSEPAQVTEQDDAVVVVEDLARRLGLPVRQVLSASGISKSTFHSWKSPGPGQAPKPRVASQGRLWALAQFVDDLDELLPGKARGWLLADPTRSRRLQQGRFDELLRDAEPTAAANASHAPAYAQAYGIGGDHVDPADVVVAARPRRRTLPAPAAPQRRRSPGPR